MVIVRLVLLVASVAVGASVLLMVLDRYNARAESVYCAMFLFGVVCYVVGTEIPE